MLAMTVKRLQISCNSEKKEFQPGVEDHTVLLSM